MSTNATQPDQAEGEREDEPAGTKGGGQGVSSTDPAEGADDSPAGGSDSAAG